MYSTSHTLTFPTGNNAFSYDARKEKMLFVPAIIDGTLDDVQL